MLELLQEGVAFEKIAIVQNLEKDSLTEHILHEASKRSVTVEELPIWKMSPSRSGKTKEVIIGYLAQQKTWTLEKLIPFLEEKKQTPFFLLMNKVNLTNNIGAIARTSYAAGVNGLVFQGSKDEFFNEDTIHYSLGAIARIPHVKMNLHEALKELSNSGVLTCALDMYGIEYYNQDLKGPAAFVFGAEREGLPESVLSLCDKRLSIPMRSGIDSLNVSNSASIILYEKVRQEAVRSYH